MDEFLPGFISLKSRPFSTMSRGSIEIGHLNVMFPASGRIRGISTGQVRYG